MKMKKEYVASPSTLCGAERITFSDGKADGVRAYRMYNGKLDITVILDRAMDIFRLFYRGTPISYITKNGLVSPKLCETATYNFLNSFDAGFLYTCGLDNVGAPNGTLPQHGTLSYQPAENVRVETEETEGEYYISLKGTVRFTALFGQNLRLDREIRMKYMGDGLTVTDTVTNDAFTEAGYMIMYHSNIGYPLVREDSKLTLDRADTAAISDAPRFDKCLEFEAPAPVSPEEVFLHTLNEGNGIKARLENNELAMNVSFDTADFPYLVEWKSMACGDYVVGIEPSTIPMPRRTVRTLAPGESAKHSVTWSFEEK